jgi:hypothetical protein
MSSKMLSIPYIIQVSQDAYGGTCMKMNDREEVPLYRKQKNQITSNVNMKKLMNEQQRASTRRS